MYSKPSLDIDLDEEYVLGLIDYLSRPSLVPYKSGNGYGLDAKVNISLRKSEILLGVISQFFDSEGIDHRYKRRDSEGVPHEILVSKAEDIQTLRDLGDGTFIQIAERLEYLVAFNQEYKGKTIAGNEGLFYRLYKPWTDMNLHGTNKNILSSFRERI